MLKFHERVGKYISPVYVQVDKNHRFEQPMDEDISTTKTWVANESVVALCLFFGICYIPQQIGESKSNLTCGYIDAFQVKKNISSLPFAKLQQLRIMWRIRPLGSTPTC